MARRGPYATGKNLFTVATSPDWPTSGFASMSLPVSGLLAVRAIDGAGRGVVAVKPIAAGSEIHVCNEPIVHVLLRPYRKEVCAQCFHYDRGRTLPVRDNEIGKVFCTESCRLTWAEANGTLGREAWLAVQRLVQNNARLVAKTAEDDVSGQPPEVNAIDAAWAAAGSRLAKHVDKNQRTTVSAPPTLLDSDHLNFFTSAVLSFHRDPHQWDVAVRDLASNDRPYRSDLDLRIHCETFAQMGLILPPTLVNDDLVRVCRDAVAAASYNAFGIRAGSDDAEEYMGLGLYPSASYFNHSCRPNVAKQRVGRSWVFSAKRDIAVGEQCCITYMGGDERDMSVEDRRAHLALRWQFVCMCERCKEESIEQNAGIV